MDYLVVDAFTRTPLEGNPVAVFLVDETLAPQRMQQIAREMNLSEVTFVMPPRNDGDVHVRIFTPVNELPFAGHPLLGTAVALRHLKAQDRFVFETGMGPVTFDVHSEQPGLAFVTMQQPIPTWQRYEHADRLLDALGLNASTLPVEAYRNGPRHVLVGCPNASALSNVHPDHRALAQFEDMSAICLAPAGDHWRCRMFSPAYGVTEDAATGSAAGPIAIHLARHRQIPWGQALHILQGVEIKRPSHMYALVTGTEHDIRSVEVSGHGAVVARGRLGI
ncbi:phenazine biosynthesis protein [Burkholderia mayonis]|uniref:Phenazine biosynthesis protein n=1 Tax=Burkholderia mayonis TaxID=1385591 RepID=A0A1B4FQB3_9BURK|nr:phenazine biosynthesis protein [Burkholderia mayonis]KVE37415.1 phenazine biosynthesis protein [Burkholderia sp. BDU5]KVE47972.1 phenazine biosynthesis protein [Burkholderia mayonis]